jgi:hypothetical protein
MSVPESKSCALYQPCPHVDLSIEVVNYQLAIFSLDISHQVLRVQQQRWSLENSEVSKLSLDLGSGWPFSLNLLLNLPAPPHPLVKL